MRDAGGRESDATTARWLVTVAGGEPQWDDCVFSNVVIFPCPSASRILNPMSSCVLAYSGGLDTSVILGWLQDEGYEVHCAYVDLGQPCEDREAILKKAHDCGAASARIVDAREELCRDFAFPVLGWQAKYEGIYLLGTSIARPLIPRLVCRWRARWGRRRLPRGDGEGERPVPVSIGGRGAGAGD